MNRALSVAIKPILLFTSLLCVLAAFRLPLASSLELLASGAFGDRYAWSRTLVKTTPLIFTGLGMVVAWRAGCYNIGGEGQFIVGGLAGAAAAKLLSAVPVPSAFDVPVVLAASVFGGAIWAGIAGWLQLRRGVEAVISTILLNFVALQLMSWLVEGPLQQREGQLPQTDELASKFLLPRLNPQLDLNAGIFLAVVSALVVFLLIFRTAWGLRMRIVGSNSEVARANLIDAGKTKFSAFLLSGGLCGLAGGVELTGVAGLVGKGFNQNWGFLGIAVALLSGLHPLLVVGVAFFFGSLLAGSDNLGRFSAGGPTLVLVVQAVAVLAFVGAPCLASRLRFRRALASI